MTRALVHVEGETEETFVNEVLAPYLRTFGYTNVSARLVGNARQRNKRGGIRSWTLVCSDIVRHLKEDPKCLATTMVDYYGLPKIGNGAWPNHELAHKLPCPQNAEAVEEGMLSDVVNALGSKFDANRFVPYVILHEFEGLLFSDCNQFMSGIGCPELAPQFQQIRDAFETPEHINDSAHTAPSKRIVELIPHYQKPLFGTLAALEVGIASMRSECPHFSKWLDKLESWVR